MNAGLRITFAILQTPFSFHFRLICSG